MFRVKPHSKNDIPLRVKWLNNPRVSLFVGDSPHTKTNLKKETTWFENYAKNRHKKFFTLFVDEIPIGFMGLSNINTVNRNADIFIAIGDDAFRGKGYGKMAMRWLLDYAFKKLRLHKANLGVIDANTPAIRLYESVGFTTEGVMKDEVFVNGKWHSMLSMAMFEKDWK